MSSSSLTRTTDYQGVNLFEACDTALNNINDGYGATPVDIVKYVSSRYRLKPDEEFEKAVNAVVYIQSKYGLYLSANSRTTFTYLGKFILTDKIQLYDAPIFKPLSDGNGSQTAVWLSDFIINYITGVLREPVTPLRLMTALHELNEMNRNSAIEIIRGYVLLNTSSALMLGRKPAEVYEPVAKLTEHSTTVDELFKIGLSAIVDRELRDRIAGYGLTISNLTTYIAEAYNLVDDPEQKRQLKQAVKSFVVDQIKQGKYIGALSHHHHYGEQLDGRVILKSNLSLYRDAGLLAELFWNPDPRHVLDRQYQLDEFVHVYRELLSKQFGTSGTSIRGQIEYLIGVVGRLSDTLKISILNGEVSISSDTKPLLLILTGNYDEDVVPYHVVTSDE